MLEIDQIVQYLMDSMKRGQNNMDGPYFNEVSRSSDGSKINILLYLEDDKSAEITLTIDRVDVVKGGYMN